VAAGVPLKPMLAKICEGIPDAIAQLRDHGGRFLAEFKYDGVRAQIHLLEDGSVSKGICFRHGICRPSTSKACMCNSTAQRGCSVIGSGSGCWEFS
jgi:ATP dependent DNA ligase domain